MTKRAITVLFGALTAAYGLGMALALSRNQMATFLEYHPTVLHDLHESVPFLYTSTGTGPSIVWPVIISLPVSSALRIRSSTGSIPSAAASLSICASCA